MPGSGRVLETGIVSRPDDQRRLLAVFTNGHGVNSGFDSIYLDPSGPVPPDGVVIAWHGDHASWRDPDGRYREATKVGMSFDSGIHGST